MKSIPLIAILALFPAATPAQCQVASPARDTVNFTVTKQRKILVEARADGHPGTFLLDTGSGDTYMGERFADSLHVPRNEGGYTYSVLGTIRFDVIDINSLELGRNRVPVGHGLIHVSNLGWVNKDHGVSGNTNAIHGIIGADILIHNQAVIDCAQNQIRFGWSAARYAVSQKLTVNFVSRRGNELAVIGRINGVEGTFIVDTGYNVSLLSPEFAYRLNAAGGGSRSHLINITGMELGSGRIIPVRHDQMVVTSRVSVVNQGYVDLGESPYDGVLGMDFLMNHHAIIDCKRMQLHID